MKTTIEIPDALFREAKARAAMQGIKLKDLIADALREKLSAPPADRPRRTKFPIIESTNTSLKITDEMVNDAIEQMYKEEAEYYAQFIRR
ncbi:MAG TPA: hypothetical protein VGK87_12930 [Anaerolineae bacterium]